MRIQFLINELFTLMNLLSLVVFVLFVFFVSLFFVCGFKALLFQANLTYPSFDTYSVFSVNMAGLS